LNNSLSERMVLDETGGYTADFKNLLKSLYGSGFVLDSNVYLGTERAPVAIAEVKTTNPKVGDDIIVDASNSKAFNSNIANYMIEQIHMGPETLEYMTEWDWSNLENLGNGTFRLKAANQGTYWNKLTVTDSNGRKNTVEFPITVKTDQPNGLEYRVINMLDNKENDISGVERTTYNAIIKNLKPDYINFVNTFWFTQVSPLPVIDRLIGDPYLQITDEFLRKNMKLIKELGQKSTLSQQLYPASNVPLPTTYPSCEVHLLAQLISSYIISVQTRRYYDANESSAKARADVCHSRAISA